MEKDLEDVLFYLSIWYLKNFYKSKILELKKFLKIKNRKYVVDVFFFIFLSKCI